MKDEGGMLKDESSQAELIPITQPSALSPQPLITVAMDAIKDDSRVERYSRMTDKISKDATERAEARATAIENIRSYCKRRQVRYSDLARRAGLSASVVSECVRGLYKGDVDHTLAKIEAAIAADANRENTPVGAFVTTEVAKQVFAVLRTASTLRTIAAVYGESGIGKSMALQAAMESQFRNGLLVEVNKGCAAPLRFLRALVAACGKRAQREFYQSADAFNYLADVLRDSGRLIAVDEADHLHHEVMDILRQLHDATRCPIVLVGRPPLGRIIDRTTRDDRIGGSFRGRMGIEVHIDSKFCRGPAGGKWLFSIDEVCEVLRRFKIRFHRSAGKWLCALANYSSLAGLSRESGGLRRAVQCFKLCAKIAKDDEITGKTARQAYALMDPANAAIVSAAIDRIVREMEDREIKTA